MTNKAKFIFDELIELYLDEDTPVSVRSSLYSFLDSIYKLDCNYSPLVLLIEKQGTEH